MTQDDLDYAVAILRKYREAARRNKKNAAKREVEHVMKVLDALYTGGMTDERDDSTTQPEMFSSE